MKHCLVLLGLSLLLSGCAVVPAVAPAVAAQPTYLVQVSPLSAPSPAAARTATPVAPVVSLRSLKGDLSNQVARLETAMPREDSERFIVPTPAEQAAMAELANQVLHGNTGRAGAIAAENGYELIAYLDRGDGQAHDLLLREVAAGRRGWGMYIFRPGTARDIVVEAPHPLSDENTPRIALALYRALSARALLIAGAHRLANRDGSADVAHSPRTVFESIHEAVVAATSPLVIQVHGFSAQKHPGYPQIVLSSSLDGADPLLDRVVAALQQEGIRVGRCGGGEWADLCGEANLQAGHVGAGSFLHVEMDESVRANAGLLVTAIQQALP